VDRIPAPKGLWQVAPRCSRAHQTEDGFNKHPIAECWRLPARDLMAVRMGAICAQASSVSNKRTDIVVEL
jgi:hypothetical protein